MSDLEHKRALLAEIDAAIERKRRAQIDSGEVTVLVGGDPAKLTCRAGDGFVIVSGVPRPWGRPDCDRASHAKPEPPLTEYEAHMRFLAAKDIPPIRAPEPEELITSGVSGVTLSQPERIWVTVERPSDDGRSPGRIREGWYVIAGRCVIVQDDDGKEIASGALIEGLDPAAVARSLLRTTAQDSFSRRIEYKPLRLA
jgi:hypothetical protein